jgi:hypothetical protein
MSLRTHHFIVLLLAGAVSLSSLAFLVVDNPSARAGCATGASVVMINPSSTASSTNTVQSGIVTLKAQSTPTTASGVSFMVVAPTTKSLGEATQSNAGWTLAYDTRNLANGTYQVLAVAHFGTATSLDCASPVAPLTVQNQATQAPRLEAIINPQSWQGPVRASAPFRVDTIFRDQYGRSSHVSPTGVNWRSPLGTVAPNGGPSTVFTAGSTVAGGILIADVAFNGLTAQATASIGVKPAGTTTNTGSGSGSTPGPTPPPRTADGPLPSATVSPLSTEEAARLASMPTIFRPASPTNTNPVVNLPTLGCLEKAVGALRFAEISGGKSQPIAAERKLAAACFSGSEAIPAVLAPVAPSSLTNLATTKEAVTVGEVKTQTLTTKDGKKVANLLLTGTGAPNSSIFLYVFSDPLVLRAETDNQGKWSYVLENQLPSGKHEVYAVAEKDAGTFVRTSAVPITVAAANQTNGATALVIDGPLSALQVGFIIGAAAMVLVALFLLVRLVRHRVRSSARTAGSLAPAAGPAAGTLIQPTAPGQASPPPPSPAPPPTNPPSGDAPQA